MLVETPSASALRTGIPVVFGTSKLPPGEACFDVLDAYAEAGGSVLDCAAVYQLGEAERSVGRWLARHAGARPQLLTKGGHPGSDWSPRLDLAAVRSDLEQSLERLGVPSVEFHLLHRDDESKPVAALADVIDVVRASGLVRWVGVSNWRTPRLAQLLALTQVDIVSNYFGLGLPAGPPALPGVVSSFDAEGHALFARTGLPLLAWSAMSAGFFAEPMNGSSMAKACANNPESISRREVLLRLARKYDRGADAILIRWLATAARHLVPLVSSTNPGRVSALMAAALDTSLDPAVADLISHLGAGGDPVLRPLLLPDERPQW